MSIRVRSTLALAGLAIAACSPDQTTNPRGGPRVGRANMEFATIEKGNSLYVQTANVNRLLTPLIPIGTTILGDDFVVPEGQVWTVTSLIVAGRLAKSSLPFSIRADLGGHPGAIVYSASQAPDAEDGEVCCVAVTDYRFDLASAQVLTAGTYWIVTETSTSGPVPTFIWQEGDVTTNSAPQYSGTADPTGRWVTVGATGDLTFGVFGSKQTTQTISFDPSTPSSALAGTSTTLHVTASSGLDVDLAAGPASVCTLSGTTLSFVGAGKCTITANQAGNADFVAAEQATRDIGVFVAQTITFTSTVPSPAYVNGTYTVSATGGGSGNPVVLAVSPSNVCTIASNLVHFAGIGTCTITANQAGGAGYDPAMPVTQTVKVDYHFDGFGDPVKTGVLNVSKTGKTIPLKWRVTDASGAPVTNLASVTVTVSTLSCSLGTSANQLDEVAAGNSGLQNLGNGFYQFNWKAPSSYANSCKTLELDLGEGSGARTAQFQFTK